MGLGYLEMPPPMASFLASLHIMLERSLNKKTSESSRLNRENLDLPWDGGSSQRADGTRGT
jgi:hypothetical protein